MKLITEQTQHTTSSREGGFVFQAVISHSINWEIVEGETVISPSKIDAMLHQVDLFPDMKFESGVASLTYVTINGIDTLKRKFEMASEAIKKRINLNYAEDLESIGRDATTQAQREISKKHFEGTRYSIRLKTDRLVLREVSASGLDSGQANITLRISTGLVDTLNGNKVRSWDAFVIQVSGTTSATLTNKMEPISSILEYDPVERTEEAIFQTIIPSLSLSFRGDKAIIDSYSGRHTSATIYAAIDYDNLFKIDGGSRAGRL